MAIVFDEVQATIEPIQQPDQLPAATPPRGREKPLDRAVLEQQLRLLHERQARLRAD